MRVCVIDDCVRPMKYGKLGWCQTHYHRYWRHGDVNYVKFTKGGTKENTANWRGDTIKYRALHVRIVTDRGKASENKCLHCNVIAEEWAYDGTDDNPKSESVNGCILEFSLDTSKYIPLCRSCHRIMDSARRDR